MSWKTTNEDDDEVAPEIKEMDPVVESAIARLMEHADHVQVFVSKVGKDQCTHSIAKGSGNWFGRYGQIKAWVKSNKD